MDLGHVIRSEIARVEAEIEDEKRAAKDCHTENQRWEVSARLRELHTRLAELERNLNTV